MYLDFKDFNTVKMSYFCLILRSVAGVLSLCENGHKQNAFFKMLKLEKSSTYLGSQN